MSAATVEPARADEAEAIADLLARNHDEATLLLQRPDRLRASIDEIVVVRGPAGAGLLACAQLHRHRPGVGEVMAVAVDPTAHGRGLGSACVRALLDRATAEHLALIWLATRRPGFFARLGFAAIPMRTIPLGILLGKLTLVVEQPARRWPAALLGGQTFMRWRVRG